MNSDNIQDLILEAEGLIQQGHLLKGKQILDQVLLEDDRNIEALNDMAYLLYQEGDYEEAFGFIKKAREIDPECKITIGNEKQIVEALPQKPLYISIQSEKSEYKVSAIVSTYNSEKFIRGCLEDLIDQTLYKKGQLEIIVIDSASPENEGTIVKEFQDKYPHIRYIRTPERETLYAAWNRGIKIAKGKYITNANTDDRHREDTFEVLSKHLDKNQEAALVYADCHVSTTPNETWNDNDKQRTYHYPDFFAPIVALHYQFGPQPMWRRRIHNTIGYFNEDFKAAGDYDFNFRFNLHFKALHIKETLGLYLKHSGAITYRDKTTSNETGLITSLYRNPETIEKLYIKENVSCQTSEEKAKTHMDMGIRALNYYPPWKEGRNSADLDFALNCFKKATQLNSGWIAARHNLQIIHDLKKQLKTNTPVPHSWKIAVTQSGLDFPSQHDLSFKDLPNHKSVFKQDSLAVQKKKKTESFYNPNKFLATSASVPQWKRTVPKVLMICHNLPPYRYGGAQLYALNLAKEMKKNKLAEVEILHPVFREQYVRSEIIRDEFEEITVNRLSKDFTHGFENSVRHPVVAKLLDEFLTKYHFDAIHIHSLGQLSAAPVEIAEKHNIPVTITLHDHWFLCFYWFLITPDQKRCTGPESIDKCTRCLIKHYKYAHPSKVSYEKVYSYLKYRKDYFLENLKKIKKLFGPSHYLADTFGKYGIKGIEVKPLGLPPTIPSVKTNHSDIHFGYMSQLSYQKGINFLINAFEKIKNPRAKLFVYGKTYKPDFSTRILKRIEKNPNIYYMGEYGPGIIHEIMATLDLLVVPSLSETYGLVIQEAFQHRVPVIASNNSAIPELVKDDKNGLLFKTGDVDDLADKIQTVCHNPCLLEKWRNNISEVRTISDDADFYAAVYSVSQQEKRKLTVQFYVQKNVHWPMFESLYEYLKKHRNISEIIICLPDISNLIGAQNYELPEKLLNSGATIVANPRQKKVDVTFIADTIAGKVAGCGKIVNIGHGTISKGYYFTESFWTERENWVDLLCVPGAYAAEKFSNVLKTRVVATGMPKLDPVFSGVYDRKYLGELLQLDPTKKIILYAPTFNIDLSSVYDCQNRFPELRGADRYLLVKLHGSTTPEAVNTYRSMAKRFSDIIFIEDPNIAPYIGGADIMISDVSSAFMEFMALDKPVLLYNNPKRQNYHGYNEADVEYAWRDLATQVDSFEELKDKLQIIIDKGDDGRSDIRRRYASELFADKHGNACENVWHETLATINNPSTKTLPVFSVVMAITEDNFFAVRSAVYNLEFYSVMPINLILVTGKVNDDISRLIQTYKKYGQFTGVTIVEIESNLSLEEMRLVGIRKAKTDFIIWMDESVDVYKNFDYIIYKTFLNHPEKTALTGLAICDEQQVNALKYIAPAEGMNIQRYAYEFLNKYNGKEVENLNLTKLPPLIAFKSNSTDDQDFQNIDTFKTAMLPKIDLCPSLFYSFIPDSEMAVIKNFWVSRDKIPLSERINIAKDILNIYFYPDVAEQLLFDQLASGIPKRELIKSIGKSLFMRFYDLRYKTKIIETFHDYSSFCNMLKKEVDLVEEISDGKKSATSLSDMRVAAPEKPLRALFYFFKNVHIPVLIPIYKKLKETHPDAEIAFGYMEHAPQIRAGFMPEELNLLKAFGEKMYAVPQEFKPDITFIADSAYPWVQDCGKLVHVGHGVLSKGQYYTNTDTARREEQADIICVPGLYHEEVMKNIISKPVTATGMAKLDSVFSGKMNRDAAIRKYGLPQNTFRYVLFAPTFNDELSAVPFVEDRIGDVVPDDKTLVIVKLHGSAKKEYKEMYHRLVSRDPRVIYADEQDIAPLLALCDLMISDVSSAMMEFAALDKPLVLFNNPNWKTYQNYNPDDIEFKWRDIGCQTKDIYEITQAVAENLAQPDRYAEKRKEYTDQLFANKYDGRAAERIVEAAMDMCGLGRS